MMSRDEIFWDSSMPGVYKWQFGGHLGVLLAAITRGRILGVSLYCVSKKKHRPEV